MQLDRIQRVALARLLSDLIEADFVVDEREMAFFERIVGTAEYGLTDAVLAEAKRMSLSQAVGVLSALDEEQRSGVTGVLSDMSLADGQCVPLEALLILAVGYALTGRARMLSVPADEWNIEDLTVIYVDPAETSAPSRQMQRMYGSVDLRFRSLGFDFVYVPRIAGDFRRMGQDYLQKVVRYMLPGVSPEEVVRIGRRLCEMTTSRFCRDLLCRKIRTDFRSLGPSFLFKLGDSDWVDTRDGVFASRTRISNFLLLPVCTDLYGVVDSFCSAFGRMVSSGVTPAVRPSGCKFVNRGFHRTLFEVTAFGYEHHTCRLVIDYASSCPSVRFESADEDGVRYPLHFSPQEQTLYTLVVCSSLYGRGLDWREQMPQASKQRLVAVYNRLYGMLRQGLTVHDYKDRSLVFRIRRKLQALQSVSNIDMFLPVHHKCGRESLLSVPLTEEYVTVRGFDPAALFTV